MSQHQAIVSVCVTAYNNEQFIAKCLDNIIAQKTNFHFEIIVFDDKSSDNTVAICKTYQIKYPGLIKLVIRETNLGASRNISHSIFECKGKYIARCDGDDYWNNNNKLQKQVDFLEANPDFVICHHRSIIITTGVKNTERLSREIQDVTDINELFNNNTILSNTCMLRNSYMPYPAWLDRVSIEDWPIYLLYTKNGEKIRHINEPMATYVKHGTGAHHSLDSLARYKSELSSALITMKNFESIYKPDFKWRISQIYLSIINEYMWSRSYFNIFFYSCKLYTIRKYHHPPITAKQILSNLFHSK